MQSVTDRRTFVRSVCVALPVLAGTSMPRMLEAVAHEGATMPPALDSQLRDLARLHNQIRTRTPTAEDLRALAAHMRSLAVSQIQTNRDAHLSTAFRDAVERHGRGPILAHQPDAAMMQRELVFYGFDRPLVTVSADAGRRGEVLDRIMRSGLAPMYFEMGDAFLGMDAFLVTNAPSSCETILEMQQTMEAAVGVMCAMAVVVPVLAPECFACTTVLAALKLMGFLKGC